MLVGEAGSRKTTAILKGVRLIKESGYKTFGPRKTTKEKFLLDLEAGFDKIDTEVDERMDVTKNNKNPTMRELFRLNDTTDPAEVLIAADEFTVFLGHNNIEFIDMLTDLWDFDDIYTNRIKNGKSVRIPYPTINILSATTNSKLNIAMPPAVISDGFFSRFILVHSESTDVRISRPMPGDKIIRQELLDCLTRIKRDVSGEIIMTEEGWTAYDEIYHAWKGLDDVRFSTYSSRRHVHLLKVATVCAAALGETIISIDTLTYANTILHYTESFMPSALGEFGKARHSDTSAKILAMIDKTDRPLNPIRDIWPEIRRDVDNQRQFIEILKGLQTSGKIQQVANGILPLKKLQSWNYPYCKISLLREYVDEKAKKGEPM